MTDDTDTRSSTRRTQRSASARATPQAKRGQRAPCARSKGEHPVSGRENSPGTGSPVARSERCRPVRTANAISKHARDARKATQLEVRGAARQRPGPLRARSGAAGSGRTTHEPHTDTPAWLIQFPQGSTPRPLACRLSSAPKSECRTRAGGRQTCGPKAAQVRQYPLCPARRRHLGRGGVEARGNCISFESVSVSVV
jgi:hypothetical protein